jgi:hypothetical protein
MKSNFLKLVLPAFAILLAVGLAFATEDNTVFQIAHYYDVSEQQWKSITAEPGCDEDGENPCLYEGYQLYSAPNFGSVQLRKD